MKSIVMSTQNVRDFLKERNLTLVKNFTISPMKVETSFIFGSLGSV